MDWASYSRISSDHADLAALWMQAASSSMLPFKNFPKWYNTFRKSGKTGTQLNWSKTTGLNGKKFGSSTHFDPEELIPVFREIVDRGYRIK